MKITITPLMMHAGLRKECLYCPTALAVAASLNEPAHVQVNTDFIYVYFHDGKRFIYKVSKNLKRWISNFDAALPIPSDSYTFSLAIYEIIENPWRVYAHA